MRPASGGTRVAGLLLLPAGAAIVLSAVALLPGAGTRAAFVLAGMGVEILGLGLLARFHALERGK